MSLEYTRKVPINIGESGVDGATDNKVLSLGTVNIADKDQSGQPRNSNVSLKFCLPPCCCHFLPFYAITLTQFDMHSRPIADKDQSGQPRNNDVSPHHECTVRF